SWYTSVKEAGFTTGVFQNHSSGRHDHIGLNYCIIHYYSPHADQNMVVNNTTMYHRLVANINIISYSGTAFFIGTVYDCSILNIRIITNANIVYISTYYSVKPDGTMMSKRHIADNRRVRRQEAFFSNQWSL